MNMIRHNNESVHLYSSAVFEQTVVEYQRTGVFGEDESIPSAEAHEICCAGSFNVRKISSVEDHESRHAAEGGCGPIQVLNNSNLLHTPAESKIKSRCTDGVGHHIVSMLFPINTDGSLPQFPLAF